MIEPTWHNGRSRLAIRFGPKPEAGLKAEKLMGDVLFPVCAPSLFDYWLIRPQVGSPPMLVRRFCEWLEAQVGVFNRSA